MFNTSHAHRGSPNEIRRLIDNIVYARVLIAEADDDMRAQARLLRLALRDALASAASTAAERDRIAGEALEAAWARLADELRTRPPAGRASLSNVA